MAVNPNEGVVDACRPVHGMTSTLERVGLQGLPLLCAAIPAITTVGPMAGVVPLSFAGGNEHEQAEG